MTTPIPVVFIHGLWLHASSWQPWADLFREAGYEPHTPGWPGDPDTVEEARNNPESIADHGIDDVVDHFAAIVAALPDKPVLVGHSFGGMIAQKLLGRDVAAAAIAIDAAQIKGVLPLPLSALRSTLPVFRNPANKHKAVSLTAEQFRFAFGNTLTEQESDDLYARWTIPAPGKPLFEAAAANFDPHSPAKVDTANAARGPLLLITGGKDHTVPESVTRATLKQYRHSDAVTDLLEFPDRGHSLTIDSGWREVASTCLTWLSSQKVLRTAVMRLDMAGSRAVVTGASRGIGLAVARALLAEGALVTGAALDFPDEVPGLHTVRADLSQPDSPAAAIGAAVSALGGLDILVNNVGFVRPRVGGFLSVTDEDWDQTLNLNFLSAVRTTRAALPHLLERGGSIVTIASVNARMPDPLVIDYSAAKGALLNFCKALSKQVAGQGVRVNTVSPGPVSTGLWLGQNGLP